MPKTSRTHADAGSAASRRAIPSVERILSSARFVALVAQYGRPSVKNRVVEELARIRDRREVFDEELLAGSVQETLENSSRATLRRVINGSGVIIHTNLGRSPMSPAIWKEAGELVCGYSNLEFDTVQGERGARDEHLSSLCASLFGCEAALLTNNNAAATLLLLAALADGKEVIVSRGELVEIGGSFRIPEVIEQGGARLKEVGTTNRTRAQDYADAVSRKTAALLRVHRSNFDIVGFTETPTIDELIAVSRKSRRPLIYDEGSGRVVDLARYGFAPADTIRQLITKGTYAVTCSTDKLIGATQGGLILGRADAILACRRHPLMRALRAGKESYGVVAATLRAFARGRHEGEISIYRMLATSAEGLRARAEALAAGTTVRVVESRCALGGGTTPTQTIPSIAIEIPGDAGRLQSRFLENDPPIVGRVVDGRFTIEVRTLDETDTVVVREAVARLSRH